MNLFERLEEEGKEKEKFQTAQNMFQDGLSWDMIQKYTGLGEKKFEELVAKWEELTSAKHA